MRKLTILITVGVVFSVFLSTQLFAKNYTFGEKKGEPIPTQYDIEEQRMNSLLDKIGEVSAKVDTLNASQQQTNEYLSELITTAGNQQQLLQKLVMVTQGGNQDAQAMDQKSGIDPQVAGLSELIRVSKEQTETLKLLVTLMYQVNGEQKTTNSLLGTSLGKQ